MCSLGYADEGWVNAITEQAGKLGHISNLFYAEPYVKAAERLCRKAGMSKRVLRQLRRGEQRGLIKLARKYSFDKYGKGRGTIITLHKSFHGRTITTLSATGQDVFHNYFFPFTEGFRHADANDFDSVEAMAGHDVCAVMFELIQGEGGVLPLDREFVQKVADLCAKRDWLLLIDEVQTGVGRTGSLFAFQQYGIQPDAVSFAKGIAGGLPFGGVMAGEKCRNVFTPAPTAPPSGATPSPRPQPATCWTGWTTPCSSPSRRRGHISAAALRPWTCHAWAHPGHGPDDRIDVKGERTNKELARPS